MEVLSGLVFLVFFCPLWGLVLGGGWAVFCPFWGPVFAGFVVRCCWFLAAGFLHLDYI
jgi:cobalamin synthase